METIDDDKLPDDEIGRLVGQLADRIESERYPGSAWPVRSARLAPRQVRPWVAFVTTGAAAAVAAAMILCTWLWTRPVDAPSWPGPIFAHRLTVPASNSPSPQEAPLATSELPSASLDPCLLDAPSADLAAAVMPGESEPQAPAPGEPGANPRR
jgi:hypothetical protein